MPPPPLPPGLPFLSRRPGFAERFVAHLIQCVEKTPEPLVIAKEADDVATFSDAEQRLVDAVFKRADTSGDRILARDEVLEMSGGDAAGVLEDLPEASSPSLAPPPHDAVWR